MGTPRRLPAPELREIADIWWDAEADPAVTWSADARTFTLETADGADAMVLWVAPSPVADPAAVARALAGGLASCDVPPTGEGIRPERIVRTLRAHGVQV